MSSSSPHQDNPRHLFTRKRVLWILVLRGLAWGVCIAVALYAIALWLLFRPFASSIGDGLADVIDNEPAGVAAPATASSAPEEAIARYLRESVAPNYGGDWEHCVPFVRIVAMDDADPSDVRAWGEFRVFNYRIEGDTFHFVSGGNHPGLMHLRETDGALAVVFFDPVLDGSEYTPSAKRIFGKHYKAWMALVADDKALEAARLQDLADYAAKNNLPAKFAKDYGWDPVPLPAPSSAPFADPATNALTNSLDSGASCVDNSPHLDN